MQLVEKNGLDFTVKPENYEDLWLLTQFIGTDDTIFSQTKRKVAIGEDKTKQVVKLLNVELLVKKIVFESQVLKITGEIQNETQFTAIGQSHTLTFSPGDTIVVSKNQLLKIQQQYLDKAIAAKTTHNLVILLDKDEIIAVEFSDFSYKVILKEQGLGSKKYKNQQINEEEQKYLLICDLLKKNYNAIVLMGPGHFKDSLKNYINQYHQLNIITTQWSDVSTNAIQKAISYLAKQGIIESSEIKKEEEVMSELLHNIEKEQKYVYGVEQTKQKCMEGACEKILLSTKLIDNKREENSYDEINDMMRQVEQCSGEIIIINSNHTPGKQLDGLGGIAGILRY